MIVSFVLYEGFETLDALGPAEMLHWVDEWELRFFSPEGDVVRSKQGVPVATDPLAQLPAGGAILVPGGPGCRPLLHDEAFLAELARVSDAADWVMSVCTGSALLGAAGVLDGRRATSNKKSFYLALESSDAVDWQRNARWCVDGRFYTASGVSAGMDMALGFITDRVGREEAERIANVTEYVWNDDPTRDPFTWQVTV